MAVAQKKAALKLPGWTDGAPKKPLKAETILKCESGPAMKTLSATDTATLAAKSKDATLDLSSAQFQIDNTLWCKDLPDTLKIILLSDNAISEFGAQKSAAHLSKLKRLELNNNAISVAHLRGLKALEALSLANNKLACIPDLTDQEELVYLDLSGNRITSGFAELGKLKNLRVLDLGDCGIDLPENEFYNIVLPHLKKLAKLEYISFAGNPIQTSLREFRYFAIQELPKIKFLNWDEIAKEDRSFAADLATNDTWTKKHAPLAHSNSNPNIQKPVRSGSGAFIASQGDAKFTASVSSRLDELLASEGGTPSSLNSSSSSVGSRSASRGPPPSGTLDDLDAIINSINKPTPKQAAPAKATTSTSSVLDELDLLLGTPPSSSSTPSASLAAPSATKPLNVPGNRGSYMELLSSVLEDTVPKTKTPPPSAAGSSPSPASSTASTPVANKGASNTPKSSGTVDPLDELDSILEETDKKHAASPAPKAAMPPPASRPVSMATPPPTGAVDPLDDILGQLEETVPQKAVVAPTPQHSERTKVKSTIFEDLESDMLDLVQEMKSPSPTVAPPAATSPAPKPKPAPSSSALSAMGNNSDLDALEQDILAMSAPAKASPAPATAPAAAPSPAPAPSASPAPVVEPTPTPPPQRGSALASLANFSSNMATAQLDNLLDSFESASAQALSSSSPSLVLQPAAAPMTPSASGRSLQRGPRASVTASAAAQQAAKPPTNPWEIPMEDVQYDFLLGRGCWGETFEGAWKYEPEAGKSMAVTLKKLYNKDFRPESVLAFRNEVKELLPLKHASLVPLVGCSVHENKVLLWRGVNGAPLWGYLRNPNNTLTPRMVLNWARQLSSALLYLHEQQVIHGGVKTTNIIIDKENNLKLKDYAFMDYKDEIPLIEAEPRWFAPELITGRAAGYNEKIDVYAFAMVVYEMMMRDSPFSSMKAQDIVDMLTHRIVVPELVPGVFPPVFIRLLNACWAHDPNERPAMDKIAKILQTDEEKILGDYADMMLGIPEPRSSMRIPTTTRAMPPRPSEPVKPIDLPAPVPNPAAKAVPKVTTRGPAASVGALYDPNTGGVVPASPSRPVLRVAKPLAIKPLETEDLKLEPEQERKLAALLSKLSEMLASGEPEHQTRALTTLTQVVKDEKHINYVATRSFITRDLVELLRANPIDTINSWRYEYPAAFETIETVMKTTTSLCATEPMALAFLKQGMMELLVEFIVRAADALKILAGQAIYELGLTAEGRTRARKAAGVNGLMEMLKTKNEFVQAQAAMTLSSVLDDEMNQEDFMNAGGLDVLGSMMSTTNAALRLRVMDALANFWNVESARPLLVSAGIKDKFMQMLTSNAQSLQSSSIRGLGKFTRYPSFQPSEVEALKILKAASEIVQNADAFVRDKVNAIRICDNLTKDRSNLANFRDMGGMSVMVKHLQDPNPEIRLASIGVLQRAIVDERSRDAIIALGAVAPLVAQLASTNTQVRMRAIATVDVLRQFPRGRTAVLANAGLSRVVSIIAFSPDVQEQMLALQLLDFFSDSPDHKEDVREAGGITAVLEVLPTLSPEGKLHAALNLGHLGSTEKNRQAIIEQKGLGPLLITTQGIYRVAEHSFNKRADTAGEAFVPDAKIMALLTCVLNMLYNLSEVGEFRQSMREVDAAQFACDFFASSSEHLQIHAVRALSGLARDPKNKVVIRTGAGKKLRELALNSTNTLLAQTSSQVQHLIDATN